MMRGDGSGESEEKEVREKRERDNGGRKEFTLFRDH